MQGPALAEAAEACADPAVAELLRATAREEADHAELSWAVLAWAVQEGGAAVEREAGRALDAFRMPDEEPSRWPATIAEQLAGHGRLPAARERAIGGAVVERLRARWGVSATPRGVGAAYVRAGCAGRCGTPIAGSGRRRRRGHLEPGAPEPCK